MSIYLNACSHGLSEPSVIARMAAYLAREEAVGESAAAAEAAEELKAVRELAAGLIGAPEAETGLASCTSAPWEALVLRMGLSGKRVLVAAHEWFSNVDALRAMGARVEVVPAPDALDPSAWAARMDGDVAAIFAPMVTSVAGIRYPVEGIGALDRPEDCLFVVDAAQALGQGRVDVAAIGCDALVGTTRKWVRGPVGTALYWMGPRAWGRTDTVPTAANPALILGQGEALRIAAGDAGTPPIARLREGVRALGLEPLSTDSGAVTLRVARGRAAGVADALDRTGCIVKWPQPERDEPLSGVTREEGALLRLSPHAYNTAEEIDTVLGALARGVG